MTPQMKGINKEILRIALPSILANITVPIVGMADIAVAGHITGSDIVSTATFISGITIGALLFDLLYGNFFFLRVSTGGLTAQAYGRGDMKDAADILCRASGLSFAIAAVLLCLQWLCVSVAFLVVDCSPQVRELASQYFFIRIWAAPATLGLTAVKGWFIGMQDSLSSMAIDLTVNITNVVASIILTLGFHARGIAYDGMGFPGVAAGTVVAQYTGALCAAGIILFKYRKTVFGNYTMQDFRASFNGSETKRFFTMNTDLFIRSLCFMGIYMGFTTFSAHYGDLLLAVSSIMMKILLLFSYFTDGFAYAGEALTGKYIGRRSFSGVVSTVKYTFVWSMGIALVFVGIYAAGGMSLLRIMTSDSAVIEACRQYLPWLVLMPLIGCAAFTWDGIFIGATDSKTCRDVMLWSVAGFLSAYLICMQIIKRGGLPEADMNRLGMHALFLAYFIHLAIRTVYLSLKYRKFISNRTF